MYVYIYIQYSVSNNVLRSICGKASCKVDGNKPKIILPVKATCLTLCGFYGHTSDLTSGQSVGHTRTDYVQLCIHSYSFWSNEYNRVTHHWILPH